MSEELGLPDELKQVEARLAAHGAASSRIDRDQLMYRAGWEGALAHIQRCAVAPDARSSPQSLRRAAWTRLLASAAASAAITVVGMWFLGPRRADLPTASPKASMVTVAHPSAINPQEATRTKSLGAPTGRKIAIRRFSYANAPLLAMREQALLMELDEIPVGTSPAISGAVTPPVSIWELRAEFLPPSERSKTSGDMFFLHWLNVWTREGDAT